MPKKRGRKPRPNPNMEESDDLPLQNPNIQESVEPPLQNPSPSIQTQEDDHPIPIPDPIMTVESPPPSQEPKPDDDEDDGEEESQTISVPDSPAHDDTSTVAVSASASAAPRRTGKKKKKKKKKAVPEKKRLAFVERLENLKSNFRPVPFVRPEGAVDLSVHEELFRRLGILDFARLDLDHVIRSDLLVQLIANYDAPARASTVNGARIKVSRPDLGRALRLPSKKERAVSEAAAEDHEVFSQPEVVAVVEEFLSGYVLLHGDMWIVMDEARSAAQLVKEGMAHKVDWAGLIWSMVEREVSGSPKTGLCYYASHLQCLMKHQRPQLFEEDDSSMMKVQMEEDCDAKETVEMRFQMEEDCDAKETVELKDSDGVQEQKEWFCLRPCSLGEVGNPSSECALTEAERFDLLPKNPHLESLTSMDLLQTMEIPGAHYNPSPMMRSPSPCRPSDFMNNGKRMAECIDEDDIHQRHFGQSEEHQKKMRIDDCAWPQESPNFDTCMGQIQSWMNKARDLYVEKERAFTDSQMSMKHLLNEQDDYIQYLLKSKEEDQQKRQVETAQWEHEYSIWTQLVTGYRKALLETRKAFADYVKRFPEGDKPIYKDVPDSGGLVLSTMELEKRRLVKEAEEKAFCQTVVESIEEFEKAYTNRFEEFAETITSHLKRMNAVKREAKRLKDIIYKNKDSLDA
ncbi:hypothetical protein QJS04_geneDACA008238 [Acorus gramineus]|uniref:Uncharacterized protein n=1 Tax=Acorus gramineus TaxID=55184 RepID=A0AAV9AZV7_ACOGR|nr:hypothetical protein QJS04_geneDACA008238 [Acorus gramineus]